MVLYGVSLSLWSVYGVQLGVTPNTNLLHFWSPAQTVEISKHPIHPTISVETVKKVHPPPKLSKLPKHPKHPPTKLSN